MVVLFLLDGIGYYIYVIIIILRGVRYERLEDTDAAKGGVGACALVRARVITRRRPLYALTTVRLSPRDGGRLPYALPYAHPRLDGWSIPNN